MNKPPYTLYSAEYSRVFDHGRWREEIPFVKFPSDWEVKVIPPTVGAMIRFLARKNGKEISVYLDCYDVLGHFGEPYWEAYPVGEDTTRYAMAEWQGLFAEMNLEFNKCHP